MCFVQLDVCFKHGCKLLFNLYESETNINKNCKDIHFKNEYFIRRDFSNNL